MSDDQKPTNPPDSATPDVSEPTVSPAMVNAAIKSHLNRFQKDIQKMLADALAGVPKPATTDDDAPVADKPVSQDKAMEAKIREMKRELAEERKARQETEAARLRDEERGTLASALRGAGISDEARIKAAMALLYTEEKRVARNAEGKIVFKLPKAGYTDEVDVAEGIAEWLKSDDGKVFAPARGAGGSSAAPGGAPRQPGQKMSKAEAKIELAKVLGMLP